MVRPRVRLMLLGIDGMDFEAARSYLDRHSGPLRDMARGGSFLPLRSTIPPNTAAAWSSIFTGVGPGSHGVFQFYDRRGRLLSSKDISSPLLWELTSYLGMKSAVVNVPMSWPPSPLKGVLVSGLPAPTSTGIVYPPPLESQLIRGDYVPDTPLSPFMLHGDNPVRAVREAASYEEQKVDLFLRILGEREWDLGVLVFTMTDRAGHAFWEADSPGEAIYEAYREVDRLLERLAERVEWDRVMVVSDHGFYGAKKSLLLPNWMMHAGFYPSKGFTSRLIGLGRYLFDSSPLWRGAMPKAMRLAGRLGLRARLQLKFTPVGVGRVIMAIGGRFVSLSGVGEASPMDGDAMKVVRQLQKAEEEAGERILRSVMDPRHVYSGERVSQGPDVLLEVEPDYVIRPGITLRRKLVAPLVAGGNHELDGVLISSDRLSGHSARVEDVAPTALAMLGVSPPRYMEGLSLFDAKPRLNLPESVKARRLLTAILRARLAA